ncbi:DUF2970 domain-containing protein [Cupriavidus basilensis]
MLTRSGNEPVEAGAHRAVGIPLACARAGEHERDLENMRPVPLILTGVTLAAGLVFCLLMVAKFVVASA